MKRYSHLETAVLVLAAGQGKRMRSDLAKVLHPVAGQPLLAHVLETLHQLGVGRVLVVVGHQRERVRAAFADAKVEWVVQAEQRGTGHKAAVVCAPDHRELLGINTVEQLKEAERLHELLKAGAGAERGPR